MTTAQVNEAIRDLIPHARTLGHDFLAHLLTLAAHEAQDRASAAAEAAEGMGAYMTDERTQPSRR